jgi:HD-like signal output (HDOD) protein
VATADGNNTAFLETLDERRVLPSFSPIVAGLINLAADEESSLREIADLIAKDPSLTTRILKLANSSFFRSLYPATTVLQAVSRIGVHHTRLLALSVSLKDALPLSPGGPIDYCRFWRLCLYQGLLARRLAETLQTGDPEEAFTAGFTLEIGLVILLRLFSDNQGLEITYPLTSLLAIEKERFGVHHREIGEVVLRSWGFPDCLVLCQRSFEERPPSSEPARVCTIAGELSACICGTIEPVSDVLDAVENLFGVTKATAIEAVGQTLEDVNEIAHLFEVETDGTRDAIELMEKANRALARLAGDASGPSDRYPSFETLPDLGRTVDAVKVTMEAVAHEIGNPLTAVGGFVRRLAKTIDPASREATYVRVIMAETERLERVLYAMRRMRGDLSD